MSEYNTDTSKWAIAVHRVDTNSAEVWFGSLFPTLIKPERARLQLLKDGRVIKTVYVKKSQWKRPFRNHDQRFYALRKFKGLEENTEYSVRFERYVTEDEQTEPRGWMLLRNAYFKTFPSKLPSGRESAFTIGLGSCFYNHCDGGKAASAYQALYERGPADTKPDITFLTGDQVYLDIGFDSLSRDEEEIRQRIGDDYAGNWQAMGSILNRGGTWMLPDDHEYWNDYPFFDSLIPQLLALKREDVRTTWENASRDGVKRIQRSPKFDVIDFSGELSICVVDLRSYRSKRNFLPASTFNKLIDWAKNRSCPGVLVIPQPLIVNVEKQERNLRSFTSQYRRLVEALGSTKHDVVVLSGDVHFGRIAKCKIGNKGASLIEIVSSPMSNLTYLNGIATSVPKFTPEVFPDAHVLPDGWESHKVEYDEHYGVSSRRGHVLSPYPKSRTKEHFMTIGLKKRQGKVQLSARAWLVRERRGKNHMPVEDFIEPFTVMLK